MKNMFFYSLILTALTTFTSQDLYNQDQPNSLIVDFIVHADELSDNWHIASSLTQNLVNSFNDSAETSMTGIAAQTVDFIQTIIDISNNDSTIQTSFNLTTDYNDTLDIDSIDNNSIVIRFSLNKIQDGNQDTWDQIYQIYTQATQTTESFGFNDFLSLFEQIECIASISSIDNQGAILNLSVWLINETAIQEETIEDEINQTEEFNDTVNDEIIVEEIITEVTE